MQNDDKTYNAHVPAIVKNMHTLSLEIEVFGSDVEILESEQPPFSHFFFSMASSSFFDFDFDFDFFSLVHFSPSNAFLSAPYENQIISMVVND